MDVYFVRHGRTDGNVAHRHQHPNTSLNLLGMAQALAVAKRLKRKKPTHLITSTYLRTIETARIIGSACQLVPETYPAFEELHRPEYLVGERILGRVTIGYLLRWFFGVEAASMHDGESYAAFCNRLALARRQLEALPTNAKVIIVSHAVFINFFLEHMNHPTQMNFARAVVRIIKILLTRNTEIIHLCYMVKKSKSGLAWKVMYDMK